jgi:hypothetical protein
VAYEQIFIKGDGACVYRSLSFCLCGNEDNFDVVINDCLTVFKTFPILYYEGVSFAAQDAGKGDIEQYEIYMTACVEKLRRNEGFINETDKLFWGEDGHIQAISLLYNITIFVCTENVENNVVHSQWRVFNEGGTTGYVCLLSAHNHVSVLLGTEDNITPSRPVPDIISGYNRPSSNLCWNTSGSNVYGRFREPFPFVWQRQVQCLGKNKTENNEAILDNHVCELCRNRRFKTNQSFTKHMRIFHRSKDFPVDVEHVSVGVERCSVRQTESVSFSDGLRARLATDCTDLNQNVYNVCSEHSLSVNEVDLHRLHIHEDQIHFNQNENILSNSSNITESCYNADEMDDSCMPCTSDVRCKESNEITRKDAVSTCMKNRVKTVSTNVKGNIEAKLGNYVCELCKNRRFKTNQSFTKHMRTFHRSNDFHVDVEHVSVGVERCDMHQTISFSFSDSLNDRKATNHANSNRTNCDVCLEGLLLVSDVDLHQDRAHQNIDQERNELSQSMKERKKNDKRITSDQNTTEKRTGSSMRKSLRLMQMKQCTKTSPANNGKTEYAGMIANDKIYSDSLNAKKSQSWKNKHSRAQQFANKYVEAKKRKRRPTNIIKKSGTLWQKNIPSKSNFQSIHSSADCTAFSSLKKTNDYRIRSPETAQDRSQYFKLKRQQYLDKWRAKYWPRVISDSNKLINKLETYVRQLKRTANDISTKVLSPEVNQILVDSALTNNELRKIVCNKTDLDRLTNITNTAKLLPDSKKWTWNAKLDVKSKQSVANDERMNIWKDYDMDIALLSRCKLCHCSDLLFGKDEHELIKSPLCHDCMALHSRKSFQNKSNNELDTWLDKIKPGNEEFPKRTEKEHTHEYLPDLSAAEKAAIALVHPVTTIKKFYLWYKRFRCESITLSQNPDTTWAKLLPRTDLKGRFVIIERTVKNIEKKYICVDSERVRQWLIITF